MNDLLRKYAGWLKENNHQIDYKNYNLICGYCIVAIGCTLPFVCEALISAVQHRKGYIPSGFWQMCLTLDVIWAIWLTISILAVRKFP